MGNKYVLFAWSLITALEILYIVYSSIILNQTSEAISECNDVWVYCLVTLILNGIQFLLILPINKINSKYLILSLIGLGVFIWSSVICAFTFGDDECQDVYTEEYPKLWILFVVIVWFNISLYLLGFILTLIMISCSINPSDQFFGSSNTMITPTNIV